MLTPPSTPRDRLQPRSCRPSRKSGPSQRHGLLPSRLPSPAPPPSAEGGALTNRRDSLSAVPVRSDPPVRTVVVDSVSFATADHTIPLAVLCCGWRSAEKDQFRHNRVF